MSYNNKPIHKFLITLSEAQLVRELRNEVRQYMTRSNSFITPEQQEEWFHKFRNDFENQHMHLYYNKLGCFLGYCYLKKDVDGTIWGSLAVKPEFQGKGYGTYIYQDMIKVYKNVFIEIFADNVESLSAAQRAGFKMLSIGDKTVVMKGELDETSTF
jgi:RimJ/RimL family protein N-acetyltransferase